MGPKSLQLPRFHNSLEFTTPLLVPNTPKELLCRNQKCLEGWEEDQHDNFREVRFEGLEMPQGAVNEGKDLKTAAKRELVEETGVVSAEIIAELPYWLTYDFSPEVSTRLSKHWGVRYKGQTHKWFLMKLTGKDEEINLLGDGTERQEFGEWSWMSNEQLLNQADKFRKPVYEQVMKEFGNFILGNGDDDVSLKQSENQLVS